MTAADLTALRAAVKAERVRTKARIAALGDDFDAIVEATAEANSDDEHDPEGATIGFERAQITALRKQARVELMELDAALDRLAAGTYGICADCGGPIATERLVARPAATTCVTCASKPTR